VTLAVTARDEASTIAPCLSSLLAAVELAEHRAPVDFDVIVVLDRCRDATGAIASTFDRVRTLDSTGGLVEAQRQVAHLTEIVMFSDADILVEPDTLLALLHAMERDPSLRVAYPPKTPLPPLRSTRLAHALHVYNRRQGFQTRRHWFSGKLFAIRGWSIPTREQLADRLARLPRDNFYDYHAGMRVDDIYLSRSILAEHGPDAIRCTDAGMLHFRPPETFEGMYRTYLRMRMEIERLDRMFPQTRAVHRRYGIRRHDPAARRAAPAGERRAFWWFQAALLACRLRYHLDRAYHRYWSPTPRDPWPPVHESKTDLWSDCDPPG